MQTRYRAAATALLLTATAGLAATGGSAEASRTHHTSTKAAHTLTITIKTRAGGVHLSDSRFRPGNTMFQVKNAGGKGLIQVLRLKAGYTLHDAMTDFAALGTSGPPDVHAVRRIDRNVVFYGGIPTPQKPAKPAKKWAVKIDKPGKYYVANLNSSAITSFKARGDRQKRGLPAQDGFINADTAPGGVGNVFKAGKHNASRGWMSTTNKAKEPHFVDIQQVKKGTTNADLTAAFNGGGSNPFVKNGAKAHTGVISPGHRFLWRYHVKPAKYAVMCFWPSKVDGTPHAFMGMHTVTRLG